jgi:hypothetical protein
MGLINILADHLAVFFKIASSFFSNKFMVPHVVWQDCIKFFFQTNLWEWWPTLAIPSSTALDRKLCSCIPTIFDMPLLLLTSPPTTREGASSWRGGERKYSKWWIPLGAPRAVSRLWNQLRWRACSRASVTSRRSSVSSRIPNYQDPVISVSSEQCNLTRRCSYVNTYSQIKMNASKLNRSMQCAMKQNGTCNKMCVYLAYCLLVLQMRRSRRWRSGTRRTWSTSRTSAGTTPPSPRPAGYHPDFLHSRSLST